MEYRQPMMFVAGEWTRGTGQPQPVLDPATNEVIAELPGASPADLDTALASSVKGFAIWRAMSAEKRCEMMAGAAALLRRRADQIAALITREQGKPVADARGEVLRAAGLLDWDANEGRRAYGMVVPGEPGFMRYGIRLPIGPVAAFTPWNFPISSPCRKIGAALAAGCSIILKASEETPMAAIVVVEALIDAGVPPDVINLVFGDAAQISDYLIAAPETRALTFTGSVPVGKHLAERAARVMKPAVMELGGHSPVIICDDVDVEDIARQAVAAKFRNAGQICTCPTRFLVQRKVAGRFSEVFAAAAGALKVGNGMEAGVQMGPLANARRIAAMTRLVADATAQGARLATGGARIGDEGNFFQPTVLCDVPLSSQVMNEEPFGPIAPVAVFDTMDEAIAIANALPYGLCSYGFTTSQTRMNRLAQEVESGIMSINHFGTSTPDTPFGGVKESGYGREGGYLSLEAFTVTKFISHRFVG